MRRELRKTQLKTEQIDRGKCDAELPYTASKSGNNRIHLRCCVLESECDADSRMGYFVRRLDGLEDM